MSEYTKRQDEEPALPDMELVNVIESMHPEERIETSAGGSLRLVTEKCYVGWLMMLTMLRAST